MIDSYSIGGGCLGLRVENEREREREKKCVCEVNFIDCE